MNGLEAYRQTKNYLIRNDNFLFNSNAVIVLGKITAAVASGGLAAAGPAAIAGLQEMLGGAGETAGGVGALMSAFVVPLLAAGGVGAGVI